MRKYVHILYFAFILLFLLFEGVGVIAQTDTLPSNADTLNTYELPADDTLNVIDTTIDKTGPDEVKTPDTSVTPLSDTVAAASNTANIADTTPKQAPPKKIIAQFDTFPMILKQGEIISKTLQVINGTEKEFTFTIDITYPGGWKPLTNMEKMYFLEPGDTFFIPVRIVPMGKIRGNTKYLIYAYIKNDRNTPVASAHFLAEKQKIIKWDINVNPGEKIYLINDENSADFSINLFNIGNEELELILDMTNFRKDRIALMDTSDKILKKPVYTFTLQQQEDTNFYFRAKYTQGLRNYRLIDTENYLPNNKGETFKYSIFAQSRESALQGKGSIMKGKKIDLIRLPGEVKIHPYGKTSLPIIMDINIANIMGTQPIVNAAFRGMTFLNNGALLTYSAQTYFSTYFFNPQILASSFFNIGYFERRFNVQIGNVGGFGGGGRGISGNYNISKNQSIGAYFARSPRLIDATSNSYGLNYNLSVKRFFVQTGIARADYFSARYYAEMFRTSVSASLAQNHNVGLGAMLTRNISTDQLNPFTKFGYMLFASYSGSYFKNLLQSSIGGSYSSPNIGITNQGSSVNVNHMSNLRAIKNLNLQLNNFYQYREKSAFNPQQSTYNNSLSISRIASRHQVSPNIFYNITNYDTIRFHSRGMSLNYSNFDYETNRMVGINVRGGYNKLYNIPELRDYFFLQTFMIFRYRVWSGSIRYTYGTVSATDLSFLSGTYPQSIGFSLNYQHQFENPHFVLNNNLTYNHINILKRHSFGYTPQLFYFTNSGWRFYVQPGYYFSISKATSVNPYSRSEELESEPKPTVSQSIIVNAGIRKEFGIPIPWVKTKYPTLIFKAFIDHDGNNKQDAGETVLENVVVKLGEWETLTNEKGLVTFRNVFGDSTYSLTAFSLVDLNGYFPNIPVTITAVKDSMMFIPFVKGVKIHGNVYLDREKITPGVEKPLDLTGIKITASNGKSVHTLTDGKGDFSFYVPFGKYIITMDEKVLGDRFTILQNNIELELDQRTESLFLTFYIVEKRRKITVKKFNGNGQRIEGSDTTLTPKPKTLEELKKEEELNKPKGGLSPNTPDEKGKGNEKQEKKGETGNKANKESSGDKGNKGTASTEPIDKSQIKFKVQIGAYGSDVPNEVVEKIKSLPDVKESRTEEGLTRYTAGDFSDYESAQALRQELINRGISSDTTFVIIIADYKGRVFSADEAKELLKD